MKLAYKHLYHHVLVPYSHNHSLQDCKAKQSHSSAQQDDGLGSGLNKVLWMKCLESNAPGTFFVSWFLATPNISQVVYLGITVDSWGFNPQNMVLKKQQKSLKKRTQIWSFARLGFTLLPPRR